jgi:hypothetical protein
MMRWECVRVPCALLHTYAVWVMMAVTVRDFGV